MDSSTCRTAGAVVAACCLVLGPMAGTAQADTAPTLTDDAGGSPLFPGTTPITPGDSRVACVVVSATGALPNDVITFAATDVTGGLAPFLTVTAEAGSGGRFGDCSGFTGSTVYRGSLTDLASLSGDGAPTGWRPAATPSRVFRITVTVAGSGPGPALTSTASFSWRMVRLSGPEPTPTPQPPTPTPPPTPPVPTTSPAAPSTSPESTPGAVPTAGPTSSEPGPDPGALPPAGPTPSGRPPGGTTSRPPVASLDIPATGNRPKPAAGRSWPVLRAQLLGTLQELVRQPAFTLGPLGVALLFLLIQHLIDRRDPKLAAASRTARDSRVTFPTDYRASLDLPETG